MPLDPGVNHALDRRRHVGLRSLLFAVGWM
jgi:hypothetical protein